MIELLLLMQVVVFVVVFSIVLFKVPSIFHPAYAYTLFHIIVFVIRPIFVYAYDLSGEWNFFGVMPDTADIAIALIMSSVAYVIFCFSAIYVSPRILSWERSPYADHQRGEVAALTITWLILGPLALYSGFNNFQNGANYVESFARSVSEVPVYLETSAYLDQAHNFLSGLSLITIVVLRFRAASFIPFVMFVGFRLFTGSRFGVVLAVMSLLFLLIAKRKAAFFSAKELAVVFGLFVVFAAVGNNRYILRELLGYTNVEVAQAAGLNSWVQWLDKPDFANFESLAYVIRAVPDLSHTFSYFTEQTELFTRPIPRMFWEGKPIGPPIQLVDLNQYGLFTTRSPGLVGVGWMGLGVAGVVLYTGLTGYIMGRLHSYVFRNRYVSQVLILYTLLIGVFLIFLRDGYILSAVLYSFWTCTPILVWAFVRKKIARFARSQAIQFTK